MSWSYRACGRKLLYQGPPLPCVRHCTRPLKYFSLSVWEAGSGGLILHGSTYVLPKRVAIHYVQLLFLKFITEYL